MMKGLAAGVAGGFLGREGKRCKAKTGNQGHEGEVRTMLAHEGLHCLIPLSAAFQRGKDSHFGVNEPFRLPDLCAG